MKQLHTTTFSSCVLRSLLALSACALLATGCGSVPTHQTQTLASATSPPNTADIDQINRIIEFHLNWFTIGGHDLAPKIPHPQST
jgi:hypothetical protein